MNVIVSNRQKDILDNANIDAIKDLNGLFNVEDLINNFKNYFFSKMIIDATSIVNFAKPETLKKLVEGIGAERLVILLPEKPEPPRNFLGLLVNLGIYNFSTRVDDIIKFLQNPNTYENVEAYVMPASNNQNNNSPSNSGLYVDNSIKDNNNNSFNNSQESQNTMNNTNFSNQSNTTFDNNNLLSNFNNNHIPQASDQTINNDLVSNQNSNNYESTNTPITSDINNSFPTPVVSNIENPIINNVENNQNTFINNDSNNTQNKNNTKMVLGFKNVTNHSGCTTLIYMLKEILVKKYNKNVLAIEVDAKDFVYYHDPNMVSVDANNLHSTVNNSNYDIILVDLNNSNYEGVCSEVLYLVEPSIIKLNKLMANDRLAFKKLEGKKIILNQSMLSSNDLSVFSHEAEMPIFFNIPPLYDRVMNSVLENLIKKLNLLGSNSHHSFFGVFK